MRNFTFELKYLALPWMLIICSFGLFYSQIGIYGDSWVVTYGMNLGYEEASKLLSIEKPFSTWLWYLFFMIGGFNPVIWNLMFLIIRLLLAFVLFKIGQEIFKSYTTAIFLSCLFSFYPGFTQYGLSQIYLLNFTLLLFEFTSFLLMFIYFRNSSIIYLFPSIVLSAISYITMDYYIGIELSRYLLLLLYIKTNDLTGLIGKRKILSTSLIYTVPTILFLFWRLFIFKTSRAISDQSSIIRNLFQDPFNEIAKRIGYIFTDTVESLFLSWTQVANAEMFNFDNRTNFISIFLFISAPIGIYFYWKSLKIVKENLVPVNPRLFIPIGFFVFLLGLSPVWFANREINLINYQKVGIIETTDRYILPGLFGVILILITFLLYFQSNYKKRIIIFSIIIGLSFNFQFRNSLNYRAYFLEYMDFFSQLRVRIPKMEENTAVFLFGQNNLFPKNSNTIGLPLNLIYDSLPTTNLKYYVFNISSKLERYNSIKLLESPIRDTCLSLTFQGNPKNVLFINYNSGESIRLIDSSSVSLIPNLDPIARAFFFRSNLNVVKNQKINIPINYVSETGLNPWTSYFLKADLASQFGDNEKVLEFGRKVIQEELKPISSSESILFLEAFIYVQDIHSAKYFYDILCSNSNDLLFNSLILNKYHVYF
jgi:hypothetical protein